VGIRIIDSLSEFLRVTSTWWTALSMVLHKFMGRWDGSARFHSVPVRFEESQELLSALVLERIAL